MFKILSISARNLLRYHRRTFLTGLLITMGVMSVLLFISLSSSFKAMMIGQITDSMLGHVQVHARGYVASLDNLPLNLMLKSDESQKVENQLTDMAAIEAWSRRIKFGAMFSNFNETTNIRLNGVYPDREAATCPQLSGRVVKGELGDSLLERGTILVPELIATGMNIKVGDTIVLVATNQDGAVNGQTFVVKAILEGISGPGGRDGYVHIEDARALLRLGSESVSEYAIRLKEADNVPQLVKQLNDAIGGVQADDGKPAFEIHGWKQLTPFSSIASMIDMLTVFVQVMLVAIVLISIMNVMIMAVYERMREIGTLAAIGTSPGRILSMFLGEGLILGAGGSLIGVILSLGIIKLLQIYPLGFSFGRQDDLLLTPMIEVSDIFNITLLVILMAVLASLQPAWKASRMDPVVALRAV